VKASRSAKVRFTWIKNALDTVSVEGKDQAL
jgi:hypothetical protein